MATPTQQPAFVMYSARAAIAGGLIHIEQQVQALEEAVFENAGLAFDLARTRVESACKTIITERGGTFDKNDDLPRLFRVVKQFVPFLPAASASNSDARRSLEQTLNGLSTALQGVCELRNACGFASHGNGGPRPVMEAVQALLAAQAADAIIGFLWRAHQADLSRPKTPRLRYEDHKEFNGGLTKRTNPSKSSPFRRISPVKSCSLWTKKPTATCWRAIGKTMRWRRPIRQTR